MSEQTPDNPGRPTEGTDIVTDRIDEVDEAVRLAERPRAGEPASGERLEDDATATDAGDDQASGEPG